MTIFKPLNEKLTKTNE